jgi:hypothetical protein
MTSQSPSVALRTRTSLHDSRVTLVTLSNDNGPASSELPATSAPTSPATRARRTRSKNDEIEGSPSTPAKSKRARAVKDEDADDDYKIAKKASPSPKKSSPTKLRAKLVEPHPEPARWKETYQIVRIALKRMEELFI